MEIIPKETPKIPPWIDILFYLSVGLLIFVFISYFLVLQSIKATESKQAEEQEKLDAETSKSAKLREEILTYQKKINDFSSVIKGHLEASNAFAFIEGQCHPKAWISDFSLNVAEGKIMISGQAQSFTVLGQQMLIFKEERTIKSANLDSISMEKGGVIGFNITLSLEPSVFVFK